MSEEQQRQERVTVNLQIFDQIKQLYTTTTREARVFLPGGGGNLKKGHFFC